jgi:hypothetical protein
MDTLSQDLGYALRVLAQRPALPVAVLTLGLGLGAAACVKPAEVARPEARVAIRNSSSSWMDYIDLRRGSGDVLEYTGCRAPRPFHVTAESPARRLAGAADGSRTVALAGRAWPRRSHARAAERMTS